MKRFYIFFLIFLFLLALPVHAADQQADQGQLLQDKITTVKAQVIEVTKDEVRNVPGTDVSSPYQTLQVQILEGPNKDKVVTVENDYIKLNKGDLFYLSDTVRGDTGAEYYSVADPYRLPTIYLFTGIFVVLVLLVGGVQGLRGLLSLFGSFALILYVLIPGILQGYSPVLVSIGVSSCIIILGSYITHGFNKTTSSAVVGMIITVIITGGLAYGAVHMSKLTGFASEEAVYLNLNNRGHIDIVGILLGGIMIGLLGVLYDVAIGQAISVEELHHIAPHISKGKIFRRALRIGREHIGALVNTLAIAYVGASLPLLLLFSQSSTSVSLLMNREIFATEIIRTLIGSIGLVLAVPVTTLLAVFMLVKVSTTNDSTIVGKESEQLEYIEHVHHHH